MAKNEDKPAADPVGDEIEKLKAEAPLDLHAKHKHAVLTDEQVDKALARARKRASDAVIADAMKRLEDAESLRLVAEEGITIGGVNDEMVTITLALAPDTAYLATDGRRYENGKTYTVKRAVANDLMARQFCGHKNESARLGEDRFAFYQKERAPMIARVGNGTVTRPGAGVSIKELGV